MTDQPAEPKKNSKLQEAIGQAMEAVPYILKQDSRQPNGGRGLGYTYASEAEITGRCHKAFVAAGLSLHPRSTTIVCNEPFNTKNGGAARHVIVMVRYKLRHVSGEFDFVEVPGEANDSGDKAVGKAMTMAYKYALRQLLMIETGDDPDKLPADDLPLAGDNTADANPPPARRPAEPAKAPPPKTGPAADKAPPPGRDLTPEEKTVERRLAAISKAPDLGKLNEYRTIYYADEKMKSNGFIKKLDAAYWERKKHLDDEARKAAGDTDADWEPPAGDNPDADPPAENLFPAGTGDRNSTKH